MLEKKEKKSLTIEVETRLLSEVKKEASKRGLTLREIVEYGLQKFLEEIKK